MHLEFVLDLLLGLRMILVTLHFVMFLREVVITSPIVVAI